MVEKTINVKLKTASDTQANWESKNITLLDGELAYDKTKKNLKIGDGTTSWNNLPYLIPEVEESGFKELYSAINFSDYLYAPISPITTNGAYFSDENGNPITESFQIGETLYITNESVKTGQVVQISALTALDEMFFEKFDDGTAHIFNQSKTYEIHFNLIGKISNYYTKSEVDELIVETPTIEVENFSQLVADQTQNATGTITEQQSSNIEKAKSLIVLDTTTSMSYYFTIQELFEGVLVFICDNTTSNVEESKIMFLLQGTQWISMELRNPRFTQGIYDELKNAFIDVVELPVENIDEEAIYRIPVKSDELVGELVVSSPSITCNKLKFNYNLSNYEMNYILSQLTYYDFNGMNIHPIWSNATATKVVFAYNYGVGVSLLYTEDITNPSNSTIIWVIDNGWVTTELQINEVGVSSLMGLPIGTENDKLRKVISMNGDFVRERSYDYLVYKDGLWSKLSNDIGTAIVEKNLYVTFADDLEQVPTFTDEEFEKLKNADNALLKIRVINANGILFETIYTRNAIGEENDEEIISFISYNISSGKLDISRLVKNENTTPKIIFERDEISIDGTTIIDVEELPVENIDEQAIYRIPVEENEWVGELVVSNPSTICNTLKFNTSLTINEVVAILSQLTYYNFNGHQISPIWSNATLTKIVFAFNYGSGKYSLLYSEDISSSDSTVIWADEDGWVLNSLDLGETGIVDAQGLPIGSENDKLTHLISMNSDFTTTPLSKYQYWNYKNGIWTNLAKTKEEVPIITIKDFLESVIFEDLGNDAFALKTSGELSGYLTSPQIQKIINAREFILHDTFDIYFTYKVFSNSDSIPLHRFTGKLLCADFLAIGGCETTELYFWFTVNANTNEYHVTYFATPINSIDIMPVHFIEITDGVMTDEQKQFFKSTTRGFFAGLRYQNLLFKNYDTSTSNTYWLTYAGIIHISGDGGKDKVCYSCIHEENIYTFSITHSTSFTGISDITTEFTTSSISSGTVEGGLKVVNFPIQINRNSNYESGQLDNTQELREADVIVVNENFLLHKSYNGSNYCVFSVAEKIVAENYTGYTTLTINESGYEYSYTGAPLPVIKEFPDNLSIYTSSSNNLHDGEAEEISLYNEIMVYAELNIYLKKVDYDEADTGNVGYSARIYHNGQWHSCYLYLDLVNNSYIWTVKNDNSGGLKIVDFPISINTNETFEEGNIETSAVEEILQADIVRVNGYLYLYKTLDDSSGDVYFNNCTLTHDNNGIVIREIYMLNVWLDDGYAFHYYKSGSSSRAIYTNDNSDAYSVTLTDNDGIATVNLLKPNAYYRLNLSNLDYGQEQPAEIRIIFIANDIKGIFNFSQGLAIERLSFELQNGFFINYETLNLSPHVEIYSLSNYFGGQDNNVLMLQRKNTYLEDAIYNIEVDELGMCKVFANAKSYEV